MEGGAIGRGHGVTIADEGLLLQHDHKLGLERRARAERAQNIHLIFREMIDLAGLFQDLARRAESVRRLIVRQTDRDDRIPVERQRSCRLRSGRRPGIPAGVARCEYENESDDRSHDERRHERHGEGDLGAERE
ncbi:MAG: hypothetical protein ABI787_09215 [Spartobacteria bacterium]